MLRSDAGATSLARLLTLDESAALRDAEDAKRAERRERRLANTRHSTHDHDMSSSSSSSTDDDDDDDDSAKGEKCATLAFLSEVLSSYLFSFFGTVFFFSFPPHTRPSGGGAASPLGRPHEFT